MALNISIIGRRVREFRMKMNLSQADLAERTELSVTYICLIETAKKQPSLESLVRIADVLGVTVNTLLNGNQTNDPLEYHAELAQLLEGCTSYEKRVIYEIASATKKSLVENRYLQSK